jgi:hypothetical protein
MGTKILRLAQDDNASLVVKIHHRELRPYIRLPTNKQFLSMPQIVYPCEHQNA